MDFENANTNGVKTNVLMSFSVSPIYLSGILHHKWHCHIFPTVHSRICCSIVLHFIKIHFR